MIDENLSSSHIILSFCLHRIFYKFYLYLYTINTSTNKDKNKTTEIIFCRDNITMLKIKIKTLSNMKLVNYKMFDITVNKKTLWVDDYIGIIRLKNSKSS